MNVEELLNNKDIYYIQKGADFLIRCLNPEHEDRNPSMRIDQVTGIYQCFSCATKGNLFEHFGEKGDQLQIKRELLRRKITQKRAESVGVAMPNGYVEYEGDWRNITPETYRLFEAFQHSDPDYIGRIVFPIRDLSGKIRAFIGRHTTQGTPKYKVSPPKSKLPLFPQVKPILGHVILVEGIFDVINLHDKGLTNAVCCFGTKNINEDKLRMLSIQGVDTIDIFFDGDKAGQDAAEIVQNLCDSAELFHRNIHLKDTDPGELSQSRVAGLKKKLYTDNT